MPTFYQKIGKYIVFFAILSIVAGMLTMLTVTLAVNYGANTEIGGGIWWNTNVFITYIIGFTVTPIIIIYVTGMKKKIIKK